MRSRKTRPPAKGNIAAWAQRHCGCCWVARAEENGCQLKLPRGDVACMSGTLYQDNHRHPGPLGDNMIFWADVAGGRVAAVELKSRNPSASHVQKQLQGAAVVIERVLRDWPGDVPFAAAVLHRKLSTTGIKAMASKRVRFRGRDHRIQAKTCGLELARLYGPGR